METLAAHTLTLESPVGGRDAAPAPAWAFSYDGKSIADSLAPYLTGFVYTDNSAGEADTLEVEFSDEVGNFKRQWRMDKGKVLRARIGWPGLLMDCGAFEIDEVESDGPPDVVRIRGLAAGLATVDLRTKRSRAHEKQTLRQIAEKIAGSHGLTVAGTIANIVIDRATQRKTRDLKFLKRLAITYGYVFSIRAKQLFFSTVYDLEKNAPVAARLTRSDVTRFRFLDKQTKTYKQAEARYSNQHGRRVISSSAAAGKQTAADSLQLRGKVENQTQADAHARAALHWKNSRATEADITLPGNPKIVAGVIVVMDADLAGGVAGRYYVLTSTHRLTRSGGYETEFIAKFLG